MITEKEKYFGHFAIIPTEVLFDERVKANEKVVYAVILALSNKVGYCFATNAYIGSLINAKAHTVSKWISHLKELNLIKLEIIRNEDNQVITRKIYPTYVK